MNRETHDEQDGDWQSFSASTTDRRRGNSDGGADEEFNILYLDRWLEEAVVQNAALDGNLARRESGVVAAQAR